MDRERMRELAEGPIEAHKEGNEMDVLAYIKREGWPGYERAARRMTWLSRPIITAALTRMLDDGRLKYAYRGRADWDEDGSLVVTPKGKKWFGAQMWWWT